MAGRKARMRFPLCGQPGDEAMWVFYFSMAVAARVARHQRHVGVKPLYISSGLYGSQMLTFFN